MMTAEMAISAAAAAQVNISVNSKSSLFCELPVILRTILVSRVSIGP